MQVTRLLLAIAGAIPLISCRPVAVAGQHDTLRAIHQSSSEPLLAKRAHSEIVAHEPSGHTHPETSNTIPAAESSYSTPASSPPTLEELQADRSHLGKYEYHIRMMEETNKSHKHVNEHHIDGRILALMEKASTEGSSSNRKHAVFLNGGVIRLTNGQIISIPRGNQTIGRSGLGHAFRSLIYSYGAVAGAVLGEAVKIFPLLPYYKTKVLGHRIAAQAHLGLHHAVKCIGASCRASVAKASELKQCVGVQCRKTADFIKSIVAKRED